MRRRAVVIGGSLGGLFAAGFLQELGWQVDVYERVADELAARGAGIGTHGALFDALRRLGVEIDERLGIRVSERICLDGQGNTVQTVSRLARLVAGDFIEVDASQATTPSVNLSASVQDFSMNWVGS